MPNGRTLDRSAARRDAGRSRPGSRARRDRRSGWPRGTWRARDSRRGCRRYLCSSPCPV